MREIKSAAWVLLGMMLLAGQPVAGMAQQKNTVTLTLKGEPMANALKKVQRQSGWKILYVVDDVRGYNVTANIKGLSPQQAVAKILEGKPFTYTVNGKYISIVKKDQKSDRAQQQTSADNSSDNLRHIVGTVTDENAEPLIGAAISVPGSPFGTVTDVNGNYELYIPKDCKQVQLSYVGMQTEQKPVGKHETNNFIMSEDKKMLDEVLVTGYQTISKERSTGAFSKVTANTLKDKRFDNLSQLLQGEVAGFNTNTGYIRGVTSMNGVTQPLYVIDGFVVENTSYDENGSLNERLPNLSVEDIESVTVLKDAAAASIYGARAANGVVVITTKKANRNKKVDVNFDTSLTWHPYNNHYEFLANSADMVDIEREWAQQNPNLQGDGAADYARNLLASNAYPTQGIRSILNYYAGNISQSEMESKLNSLASRGYSYYKDVEKYAKRDALYQKYHLSIGAASTNNNFIASLVYRNNKQNDKYTNDNSWGIDLKDYLDITDWLHLQAGSYTYIQKQRTQYFDPLSPGYSYMPYDVLKNDDGSNYTYTQEDRLSSDNLQLINSYGLYNQDITPLDEIKYNNRTTNTFENRSYVGLGIDFTSFLKYNVKFQYDYQTSRGKQLFDKNSYYVRNLVDQYATDNDMSGVATYNVPFGNIYYRLNNTAKNYLFRQQLDFDKTFGEKHNIVALAGHEVRKNVTDYNDYRLYNYDTEMLTYALIDQSVLHNTNGLLGGYGLDARDFAQNRELDDRYVSWFLNAAYTYDDRYMASASIRWDKSNLWGTNSKYQNKPIWSLGAGWNIDKEQWFHVAWIDRLKLRVSHGIAGNIAKDAAPYMTAYYNPNYNTGGQYGTIASRPNPTLRWEKTTTTNIGVDFSMFKGRLDGTVEVYDKRGSDLLANTMGVPTEGFGYSTYQVNNGKMTNKGVEVTLNGNVVRTNDFRFDAGLTFSYNKNKVTYVNVKAPVSFLQLDYPQAYPIVGNPYYSIYGYKWAGLSSEGLPQVYDADGNVVSYDPGNLESLHYLGTSDPTTLGSLNLSFGYKHLSLTMLWVYQGGYKMRNTALPMLNNTYNSALYGYVANIAPVNKRITQRWRQAGDEASTNIPRIVFAENSLFSSDLYSIYYYSDANILNAANLRLSNISLAYDFTGMWLRKLYLNGLRLQLNIENVATFTHSKDAKYLLNGYDAPNYSLTLNLTF